MTKEGVKKMIKKPNLEYPEIKKAKIQRKEEIEALKRSLEEAENEINKNQEVIGNALITNNLDEYTNAQNKLEAAETKAEFCRVKIKALENEPYFEKGESKAKAKGIKEDIKKLISEEGQKAAKHLNACNDILSNIQDNIKTANLRLKDLSKNNPKNEIPIEEWPVAMAKNSIENLLKMDMFKG